MRHGISVTSTSPRWQLSRRRCWRPPFVPTGPPTCTCHSPSPARLTAADTTATHARSGLGPASRTSTGCACMARRSVRSTWNGSVSSTDATSPSGRWQTSVGESKASSRRRHTLRRCPTSTDTSHPFLPTAVSTERKSNGSPAGIDAATAYRTGGLTTTTWRQHDEKVPQSSLVLYWAPHHRGDRCPPVRDLPSGGKHRRPRPIALILALTYAIMGIHQSPPRRPLTCCTEMKS